MISERKLKTGISAITILRVETKNIKSYNVHVDKTALFVDGFPPGGLPDNTIVDYLDKKGYKVVIPDYLYLKGKFDLNASLKFIEKALNGARPHVVAGVSMGGLLIPHLAKKYPEAKLIFLDTGPYFKPDSKIFYFLLKIQNKMSSPHLIKFVFSLPKPFRKYIFEHIYKFKGNKSMKNFYDKNFPILLDNILSITPQRGLEIVNFTLNTNNEDVLQNIQNPSLIIASERDLLMPPSVVERLRFLLKDSVYFKTEESHLHFITVEEKKVLDDFLK